MVHACESPRYLTGKVHIEQRVLMGVPSYQLTTNFSANCQLTTNFS